MERLKKQLIGSGGLHRARRYIHIGVDLRWSAQVGKRVGNFCDSDSTCVGAVPLTSEQGAIVNGNGIAVTVWADAMATCRLTRRLGGSEG